MNAHEFRRIAQALAPLLEGARIQKIQALSDRCTQFVFFGQAGLLVVLLQAGRQDNLLCVAGQKTPTGTAPPASVMRLRKYVGSKRVQAVHPHWLERQLWLLCGTEPEVWLCLDLQNGPLLEWQAPAPPQEAQWPDPQHIPPLDDPQTGIEWPVLVPALRKSMACLPLPEQAALLQDLEAGGGDLFVYESPDKKAFLSAWPLPQALRQGLRETVHEDVLQASRYVGESLIFGALAHSKEREAAKPLVGKQRKLRTLLKKLEAEEARLGRMAAQHADALALQHQLYRFGAKERLHRLEVEQDGHTRTLELNPRHSVRDNMAAMFHAAGRGKRGLDHVRARRALAQAELAALTSPTALPEQAPKSATTHNNPGAPRALAPKGVQLFVSSDGFTLLRGKSAEGNMQALKVAGPDDLWLHAEGAAGAHVIIRRAKPGQEIPQQTLHEAAVLAALKSPYKDAGHARIQCAQVRHVHPMRGTKGMVRIDRHEPSVDVRPDASLEQKLAQE